MVSDMSPTSRPDGGQEGLSTRVLELPAVTYPAFPDLVLPTHVLPIVELLGELHAADIDRATDPNHRLIARFTSPRRGTEGIAWEVERLNRTVADQTVEQSGKRGLRVVCHTPGSTWGESSAPLTPPEEPSWLSLRSLRRFGRKGAQQQPEPPQPPHFRLRIRHDIDTGSEGFDKDSSPATWSFKLLIHTVSLVPPENPASVASAE
jgi:hypothetical protein